MIFAILFKLAELFSLNDYVRFTETSSVRLSSPSVNSNAAQCRPLSKYHGDGEEIIIQTLSKVCIYDLSSI